MNCSININESALIRNINTFLNILPPGVSLGGVIKSNAYGHGVKIIAPILENFSKVLLVYSYRELKELREIYSGEIILLGVPPIEKTFEADELIKCLKLEPIFTVGSFNQLLLLEATSKTLGKNTRVHLCFDARFGRRGFLAGQTPDIIEFIRKLRFLKIEGLSAHLSAPASKDGGPHTLEQLKQFFEVVSAFKSSGFNKLRTHIAATGGVLKILHSNEKKLLEKTSLVRVGIGLYGLWPDEDIKSIIDGQFNSKIKLSPVLELNSVISGISESRNLVKVGLGFDSGLPQSQAEFYDAIISGVKLKGASKLTRNYFLIKSPAEKIKNFKIGDKVTLIGKNGGESISCEEVANKAKTINYEVVTRLSRKIPRLISS